MKKPHAGHGFRTTEFEHHPDGSITISFGHEDPGQSVTHAVADLDGAHDSLEDHLRAPEAIEADLKEHGVDPEKLEEVVHPGLHDEALDKIAEEHNVDPEDVEEMVSPGIHEKMAGIMEKS